MIAKQELTSAGNAKMIDLAIFWLPLIGTLLLGSIAVGAWYAGEKNSAIWFGFAGSVCLLLTFTLQFQKLIDQNGLQPMISMLPPVQRSVLRWDPDRSYAFDVRGENDQTPVDQWTSPIFPLENSGAVAQDIRIKWSAPKYDVNALLTSSDRFKAHVVKLDGQRILFSGKPGVVGFANSFAFSNTIQTSFITKSAETFIPFDVWNSAALIFVATLGDKVGAISQPYYFDVEVSWNIPDGGKPARFRVKAIATNAKPYGVNAPEVLANVEFSMVALAD